MEYDSDGKVSRLFKCLVVVQMLPRSYTLCVYALLLHVFAGRYEIHLSKMVTRSLGRTRECVRIRPSEDGIAYCNCT